MQAVAVEQPGTYRPPPLHSRSRASAGRLLFWTEDTAPSGRHQARDRMPVSRDHVFGAGFDVTNAARKRLVRLAKGDRLGHHG
jgi:hypothetical protein